MLARMPFDGKLLMEEDVHANLIRSTPVDLLIEEVEDCMKQQEPEEWKPSKDTKSKLARGIYDTKIPTIDPMIAHHNKLARLPDHDVKMPKKKKKLFDKHDPQALRIIPDYE